jgi:tetratricopeptide (TPR) repeat protein
MFSRATDPKKDRTTMSRLAPSATPPRRLLAPLAALALGLLFASGARAQALDDLEQKDGKKIAGTVTEAGYEKVEIRTRSGVKQAIPWDNVARLKFGGSVEFSDVADKVATAPLDESIEKLEKLNGDKQLRAPLRQEVLFLLASVRSRKGDLDGAIAGWQALLKEFPTGRYLDVAIRGMVESMLAKGQAADAGKALDQAATEAAAANPGPHFNASVALLKARVLEAQGNSAGALNAYKAVEATGSLSPDQAAMASLGIAHSLQLAGQLGEAETRYRKIATSPDMPHYVYAGAWNGIGDILAKPAREKRDGDKLIVALMAYLRAAKQYLPLEGEPTAEHARALDSAAETCRAISQVDANYKQLYTQRAQALAEERKRLYGAPSGK